MKVRTWPAPPDLRLTAHVVAGRYRLDDLLGRGGAADVYEGRDLRLHRPVAVKVFRPGGESQMEERFDGEGRLLAQMQHPGLVTVYDSGHEDGRPYLVMQLIKGTTLRRRIAAGPLTPAEASRIGAALASALAHVHAAGVVHRDVKPSNILLDGTGTPYLTDFGISRLLDATAHTATGTLVGTAAYMAPEQVLGKGAAPAADVYSLGLVLLEALKGELEYAGAPLEAAIARLHRPPAIPPDLSADLVELLKAMTDPEETGRPDAHACHRALAAMQGGDSASSCRGVGPSVDVRNAGEDRNAAGDTLRSEFEGARTGGAGPVLATTPSEGPPPPDPLFTVPASRRSGRALLATGAALAVLGVTLTGSIGGLPSEDEDAASRPRQATTESTSGRADGTSEPSSDRAGHPGPSSSPAATPAVPRSRTMPSLTESGTNPSSAADEREDPTTAAGLQEPDSPRGEAVRGPVRVDPEPRPGKAKPPRKNHSDGPADRGGEGRPARDEYGGSAV